MAIVILLSLIAATSVAAFLFGLWRGKRYYQRHSVRLNGEHVAAEKIFNLYMLLPMTSGGRLKKKNDNGGKI